MKVRIHISEVKQEADGTVKCSVFLRDSTDTRNIGASVKIEAASSSLPALRAALRNSVTAIVAKLSPEERLRLVASDMEQEGVLLL